MTRAFPVADDKEIDEERRVEKMEPRRTKKISTTCMGLNII
jgi:hypothetical protein